MRARVLFLLVAVALCLLVLPGMAQGGDGLPTQHPVAQVVYTVQPGDTLWSIARRVAPDRDPRAVVDELSQDNQLQGILQAGQELWLPAAPRR